MRSSSCQDQEGSLFWLLLPHEELQAQLGGMQAELGALEHTFEVLF